MLGSKKRIAEVGDMIIQHDPMGDQRPGITTAKWVSYTGIVHKVTRNKWGHETVFIHWPNGKPPRYREDYGYPSMNIHNLRRCFDVIKGKK